MQFFVFGHRGVGLHHLHGNTILLQDAFAEFQGLGELVAGVQVDDPHALFDPGEQVYQTATLGPESRCHHEFWVKTPNRILQDFPGGFAIQLPVQGGDFLVGGSGAILHDGDSGSVFKNYHYRHSDDSRQPQVLRFHRK